MFVLFVLSLFPISQDISEATPYGLSYRANLCLFVLESAIQSSLSCRFNFRVLAFKMANPGWLCPVVRTITRSHRLSFSKLQGPWNMLDLHIFTVLLFLHKQGSAYDLMLNSYHQPVLSQEDSVLVCMAPADARLHCHLQDNYHSQQALRTH